LQNCGEFLLYHTVRFFFCPYLTSPACGGGTEGALGGWRKCLDHFYDLLQNTIIPSKKDRKIAHGIYNIAGQDFLHRVVFVEHMDFMEVITTYLTTKIGKYWRCDHENKI